MYGLISVPFIFEDRCLGNFVGSHAIKQKIIIVGICYRL